MNSESTAKFGLRDFAILAAIAVVLLAVRLTFLHEPLERDEGYFACIGQEILRGGIPYKDAIDMKPPGVFYYYAAAIASFGKSVESIRLFTALYSLGTLAAVFWLARRLAGPMAGFVAALMFALYSPAPLMQGSSGNSEVVMILPLMLSACFLLLADERKSRGFLAASGLFAGLALLVKTVALPYLLLLLVCSLFLRINGDSAAQRFLNALFFTLPPTLLAGLTLAYFHFRGALNEFIAWNVTIPFIYSKGGGVDSLGFINVAETLAPELLLPALASFSTAVWIVWKKREPRLVATALLLPAACLGVWLPGKFFAHYFIQLIPFMSVLAGIGFAELFRHKGKARYLAAFAAFAAFLAYPANDYLLFTAKAPEDVSIMKYGKTFAESERIAVYLQRNTRPTDYIFQWGFEPELYFLADRPIPGPYISSTIFESITNKQEAVRHLVRGLVTRKPAYIVVQPKWADYPGQDEVRQILMMNYRFETSIGYGMIYRRLE